MIQAEDLLRRHSFLRELLERTGYALSDVLSISYVTNIVLMRNGGKYRIKNGKVEHLAGPSPDPEERI